MGGGQPGVEQQLNYGPYYGWGGGNAQKKKTLLLFAEYFSNIK